MSGDGSAAWFEAALRELDIVQMALTSARVALLHSQLSKRSETAEVAIASNLGLTPGRDARDNVA